MDAVDLSHWNQAVQVSVPILGMLLSGNLLFGFRLLKRLDRIDETVSSTFPVYNSRLSTLEAESKVTISNVKDLDRLRERVAVLEYAGRIHP